MTERERLIELLSGKSIDTYADIEYVADYLLKNGVIVMPCNVYITRASTKEDIISEQAEIISRQQAEVANYIKVAEYQQGLTLEKSFEIKELKEENAYLKSELLKNLFEKAPDIVEKMKSVVADLVDQFDLIKFAKAEAIKEFAERLKKYLLLPTVKEMSVVTASDIDNLVKEMVGSDNG